MRVTRETWVPRPHDRLAVTWLVKHAAAGLLLDPGMGKTSIFCHAFLALQKAKAVRRALVVAPLRPAQLVWTQEPGGELARWASLAGLKVALLHGTKKDQRLGHDADLYVINYDGLKWLVEGGGLEHLVRTMGVDLLCLDELSKLKDIGTRRFKLLKPWLPRFRRRVGLTGTPASNGLLGLFGQAFALDLGRALGPFVTHYRSTYFHSPTRYVWHPYKDSLRLILRELKPLMLSIRAEDAAGLELPAQLTHDVWVDLPVAARRTYDELRRDLCVLLDEDTVATAGSAAILSGKLRQVASGGLYVHPPLVPGEPAPPRATRQLHDAKTEALLELVEELQGQPLLVAYEFQHDLDRLRAALGDDVPTLGGGATLKQAQDLVARWNRGELPVLLAHPAAMGHGLNLQGGGSHVCWYSLTWDLDLYEQLNRRLRRPGNRASTVVVHRLLARGTVDELISGLLARKRLTQEELLDGLRCFHRVRGRGKGLQEGGAATDAGEEDER
jgi:hypothetical protein